MPLKFTFQFSVHVFATKTIAVSGPLRGEFGSRPCSEGFSPGSSVFLPPEKKKKKKKKTF